MKDARGLLPKVTLALFLVVGASGVDLTVAPRLVAADDESVEAALQQATETGSPIPVPSLFTESATVMANPDGTLTAQISSSPFQVPDTTTETGWAPIDTTLLRTADGVVPVRTAADMTFPDGGVDQAAILGDGSRTVSIGWDGPLPEPLLEGNRATYEEVAPGVDLVLDAQPIGFEMNLVIQQAPTSPLSFDLPFEANGLTAEQDRTSVALTDVGGEAVALVAPPAMWDTPEGPNDVPDEVAPVGMTLSDEVDGDATLRLTPDPEYFSDPDVTYPVTI